MTGYGAYCYLVWGVWLRHCLNERQDEYVLKWPSIFFSIPEVVPLSVYPQGEVSWTNGHTNGHANGYANGHVNGNGHSKGEDRKSV